MAKLDLRDAARYVAKHLKSRTNLEFSAMQSIPLNAERLGVQILESAWGSDSARTALDALSNALSDRVASKANTFKLPIPAAVDGRSVRESGMYIRSIRAWSPEIGDVIVRFDLAFLPA